MAIQAIETRYAGCRFRSRLEARWAVFFDTLGIPWEYEPEGIEIPRMAGGTTRYLPDFWLPRSETHVEVKGTPPTSDYLEMLAEAIDFHGPLEGGLLLLGPIPDVSNATVALHSRVEWHKGVEPCKVTFDRLGCISVYTGIGGIDGDGTTAPEWPRSATWDARVLVVSIQGRSGHYRMAKEVKGAYEAARSARFEHGETPTQPKPRPTLGAVMRGTSGAQAARDALSAARVQHGPGLERLLREFGGDVQHEGKGRDV